MAALIPFASPPDSMMSLHVTVTPSYILCRLWQSPAESSTAASSMARYQQSSSPHRSRRLRYRRRQSRRRRGHRSRRQRRSRSSRRRQRVSRRRQSPYSPRKGRRGESDSRGQHVSPGTTRMSWAPQLWAMEEWQSGGNGVHSSCSRPALFPTRSPIFITEKILMALPTCSHAGLSWPLAAACPMI